MPLIIDECIDGRTRWTAPQSACLKEFLLTVCVISGCLRLNTPNCMDPHRPSAQRVSPKFLDAIFIVYSFFRNIRGAMITNEVKVDLSSARDHPCSW
jgi:hypothetical protein